LIEKARVRHFIKFKWLATKLDYSCMSNSGTFNNNLKEISSNFLLVWRGMPLNFSSACWINSIIVVLTRRTTSSRIYMKAIVLARCNVAKYGHCSYTSDPMLSHRLGIAAADTLIDALQSFIKAENIEDTKFTCQGCEIQVLRGEQTKIDQALVVIALHHKRFRNDRCSTNKIDKFVKYPSELDLMPFMSCP
jgi:hypothetical protein